MKDNSGMEGHGTDYRMTRNRVMDTENGSQDNATQCSGYRIMPCLRNGRGGTGKLSNGTEIQG